jgi:hypothetical protein
VTPLVHHHAPVPEERAHRREVERGGRVARDELALGVNPGRAEPGGALADRETAAVARTEGRQVAAHAGDVVIPAQDLVEGQRLAQPDQLGPDLLRQRGDGRVIQRKRGGMSWSCGCVLSTAEAQDLGAAECHGQNAGTKEREHTRLCQYQGIDAARHHQRCSTSAAHTSLCRSPTVK